MPVPSLQRHLNRNVLVLQHDRLSGVKKLKRIEVAFDRPQQLLHPFKQITHQHLLQPIQ